MLAFSKHNRSLCENQRPPNCVFGPLPGPSAQFGAFSPVFGPLTSLGAYGPVFRHTNGVNDYIRCAHQKMASILSVITQLVNIKTQGQRKLLFISCEKYLLLIKI